MTSLPVLWYLLCVWSGIRHGQNSLAYMFQFKVFVGKFLTVDALASSSIVVRKITSLAHEIGNHTVKRAALETETLFPSAKGSEVFSGLRNDVGTEFKCNATNVFSTDFHVEEYCGGLGEGV